MCKKIWKLIVAVIVISSGWLFFSSVNQPTVMAQTRLTAVSNTPFNDSKSATIKTNLKINKLAKLKVPRTITTGTIGTSSWKFDDTTGTLTLGAGKIDIAANSIKNNLGTAIVSATKTINITGSIQFYQSQSAVKNGGFFAGLTNLTDINELNQVDTSQVTDMSNMFSDCSSITSLDLRNFKTDNVVYMNGMFSNCSKLANLDVSGFDTSKVTSMASMFYNCKGLTSLDVSKFDTSKVTSMSGTFYGCSSLTSLDVSNFNTANVISMGAMFRGCSSLTNLDVSGFNTSKVTNLDSTFYNCSKLTSLDVSGFDTSQVTNMNTTFTNCSSLTNLDVSHFITNKVTNMNGSFQGCSGLTSLDVSNFDTSQVTSMQNMFNGCSKLTNLDVSGFNTSHVTTMLGMFESCISLTFLNVSNFDTSSVTDMSRMFISCSKVISLDVSKFNTSKVANMANMFNSCSGLTSLDVSNFSTSNVGDMNGMFNNCSGIAILDVSGFDTSKVTNMSSMFSGCSGLTGLNVSKFNTARVTNMRSMFQNCNKLTSLDLSNFDTNNSKSSLANMLQINSPSFNILTLGPKTIINGAGLTEPSGTYKGYLWTLKGGDFNSPVYTSADLMLKYDGSTSMVGTYVLIKYAIGAHDSSAVQGGSWSPADNFTDVTNSQGASLTDWTQAQAKGVTATVTDSTGKPVANADVTNKPGKYKVTFNYKDINGTNYTAVAQIVVLPTVGITAPTNWDFGNHEIEKGDTTRKSYSLQKVSGTNSVTQQNQLQISSPAIGANSSWSLGVTLSKFTAAGQPDLSSAASKTSLVINNIGLYDNSGAMIHNAADDYGTDTDNSFTTIAPRIIQAGNPDITSIALVKDPPLANGGFWTVHLGNNLSDIQLKTNQPVLNGPWKASYTATLNWTLTNSIS